MSEGLIDDLTALSQRYELRETLAKTADHTTEVVCRRIYVDGPSIGPLIRKTYQDQEGPSPFERLLAQQVAGRRFHHHPFLYECEHKGSTLEVVMQYVKGSPLDEVLTQEGPGVPLAIRVMPQLFAAILELHEGMSVPVVHGAIKPSNVILTEGGVVLIGLRPQRRVGDGDLSHSMFEAPELREGEAASRQSDLYALGMVCAYLCTGEVATHELPASRFQDRRIPPALVAVLERACAYNPKERFGSVRDMRYAFFDALGIHNQEEGAASRASVGQARRQGSGAQEDGADGRGGRGGQAPVPILGILWNVVVGLFYLVSVVVGVRALAQMASETNYPLWAKVFVLVGVYFVPISVLAYALIYKQPFRDRMGPLKDVSRKRELITCALIIACSISAGLLLVFLSVPLGIVKR